MDRMAVSQVAGAGLHPVGAATTPRAGKRTVPVAQSFRISEPAQANTRSRLMCQGRKEQEINGILGTKQQVVSESSGRRLVADRSGGVGEIAHAAWALGSQASAVDRHRRPAAQCGSHAAPDRNSMTDFFVENPPRKHTFRHGRRTVGEHVQRAPSRGATIDSTRTAVSPATKKRHYLAHNSASGMLRSDPDSATRENTQQHKALAASSRHHTVPGGNCPAFAAAGYRPPQQADFQTLGAGRKRHPAGVSARGMGTDTGALLAGQYAVPRNNALAAKIGSVAWG